jgi:hypothetical protein
MDAVALFVVVQMEGSCRQEYAMTREEQKRFDALYARHLRALETRGLRESYNRFVLSRGSSAVGTLLLDCVPDHLAIEQLETYFS